MLDAYSNPYLVVGENTNNISKRALGTNDAG